MSNTLLVAREEVSLKRLHIKVLLLRARNWLRRVCYLARRISLTLDEALLRYGCLVCTKTTLCLHHGHVALLVIDENKVLVLLEMQLVGCLMMRFTGTFTWYFGLGRDATAIGILLGTGHFLRGRMRPARCHLLWSGRIYTSRLSLSVDVVSHFFRFGCTLLLMLGLEKEH